MGHFYLLNTQLQLCFAELLSGKPFKKIKAMSKKVIYQENFGFIKVDITWDCIVKIV